MYKKFKAYNSGHLRVSNIHRIYYEESGNPKGQPVVVLHGGPGSQLKENYKQYFNPKKWRVIMFDQRGCGRSTPRGEIQENTIGDLIQDMEKLRAHLSINHWVVTGGSWGSTLALVYTQVFPHKVCGLQLSGVWLCRQKDIDWFVKGVALRKLFPDLWTWRVAQMKKSGINPKNPTAKMTRMILHGSRTEQKVIALINSNWEGQFLKASQEPSLLKKSDISYEDIADNKIFQHYFSQKCFLAENYILKNIKKIPRIPVMIVHGRYDVVCALDNAWELAQIIPQAILDIAPTTGHHGMDGKNPELIILQNNQLLKMLKK